MTTKAKAKKEIIVKESKAIMPVPQNGALSLMQQAEVLIKSGMLPAHLTRPEQVVAIMMRGKELGIGPMESLTSINFFQGKVSSSTQLMLALIYRSGLLEDIEMLRADPAKCTMKRRGMTAHTVEFGKKDAAAMGLLSKDTYKKFPETMYLWRCIAMCARVVFPDIIGAVYTPDELGMEIQGDVLEVQDDLREKIDAEMIAHSEFESMTAALRNLELAELLDRRPDEIAAALNGK